MHSTEMWKFANQPSHAESNVKPWISNQEERDSQTWIDKFKSKAKAKGNLGKKSKRNSKTRIQKRNQRSEPL